MISSWGETPSRKTSHDGSKPCGVGMSLDPHERMILNGIWNALCFVMPMIALNNTSLYHFGMCPKGIQMYACCQDDFLDRVVVVNVIVMTLVVRHP